MPNIISYWSPSVGILQYIGSAPHPGQRTLPYLMKWNCLRQNNITCHKQWITLLLFNIWNYQLVILRDFVAKNLSFNMYRVICYIVNHILTKISPIHPIYLHMIQSYYYKCTVRIKKKIKKSKVWLESLI